MGWNIKNVEKLGGKNMFNKRNKKRGFTLIELIIVIAIIAILAAIAVPAFGQIRQKANASADLANARTIFSVVATQITSDEIQLPALDAQGDSTTKYYNIGKVGEKNPQQVGMNSADLKVKQIPNGHFVISLDSEGDIAVGFSTTKVNDAGVTNAPEDYQFLYGDESHIPKAE